MTDDERHAIRKGNSFWDVSIKRKIVIESVVGIKLDKNYNLQGIIRRFVACGITHKFITFNFWKFTFGFC